MRGLEVASAAAPAGINAVEDIEVTLWILLFDDVLLRSDIVREGGLVVA